MKKILFMFLLLLIVSTAVFAAGSSVSTGLGMVFFNYQEVFLSTGVSFHILLAQNMELGLGFDFALWPNRGDIQQPRFFIPLNGGLDFLFGQKNPQFLLGIGLSPVFIISPEPVAPEMALRFYAGPYLKGGIRVRVHPYMSWYFSVQQDLSIGVPNWINTATRVATGINFHFAGSPNGASR